MFASSPKPLTTRRRARDRVCSNMPPEPVRGGVILGIVVHGYASRRGHGIMDGTNLAFNAACSLFTAKPRAGLAPAGFRGMARLADNPAGINFTLATRLWHAARASGRDQSGPSCLASPRAGCRCFHPFSCVVAASPRCRLRALEKLDRIRDHCGVVGEEQTADGAPTPTN